MITARQEALINPSVLLWAREDAGYELNEAAKKIPLKPEKLYACEVGEARLTVSQLRKLCVAYKRPLAFFYLPSPPQAKIKIKDFRRLPDENNENLSPQLRLELRRARYRREIALDLFQELEIKPRSFIYRATIDEGIENVAQKMRVFLNVSKTLQSSIGKENETLHFWREIYESNGILVFQASIKESEVRGFSIFDNPLPIIVINSKDSIYGRIFTLFHELTHIFLRSSGLCDWGEDNQVEVFCNAVAGEALVPTDWLINEPIVQSNEGQMEWSNDKLRDLSVLYKVSAEVILRRLLTLKRTSQKFYQQKRREWKDQLDVSKTNELITKKKIIIPQDVKTINKNGRGFVRLVLDGLNREKIGLTDVSRFLDVKIKHITKIENSVNRTYIPERK